MGTNECAVYAVEHPDHICDVYFPLITEEDNFKKKWIDKGAVWLERLCTVNSFQDEDEEVLLARYCSRRMISLYHYLHGEEHFLPFDVAEKLLEVGRSDWGWMPDKSYGPSTVLRFPKNADPEVIVRPYDGRWERNVLSGRVDLFIQHALVRPTCTLSVDENDLRHADCDWRECLGTVQANHLADDVVEVRLDNINELIHQCSVPMVAMSQSMPPSFIPQQWLVTAVGKATRVV